MKKAKKKKADFFLDMPFDEALERYAGTSQQELERVYETARVKKKKVKKKSGGRKALPPDPDSQKIVRLSARRKLKR